MVICSKQSFCHEATNTQKGEAVHCEPVTNGNCMSFILISSAHQSFPGRPQLVPEQNHNQAPEPQQLHHAYTSTASDHLSRKWSRWSTQESRHGRSGPTQLTVRVSLVHLCSASSSSRELDPAFICEPSFLL